MAFPDSSTISGKATGYTAMPDADIVCVAWRPAITPAVSEPSQTDAPSSPTVPVLNPTKTINMPPPTYPAAAPPTGLAPATQATHPAAQPRKPDPVPAWRAFYRAKRAQVTGYAVQLHPDVVREFQAGLEKKRVQQRKMVEERRKRGLVLGRKKGKKGGKSGCQGECEWGRGWWG